MFVDTLIWFYSDFHIRESFISQRYVTAAPDFQDSTSQTGNTEHKKSLNYKILRREETRRDALKPSEQNVSICCTEGGAGGFPSSSPRVGFVREMFSDFPSGDLRVTPE